MTGDGNSCKTCVDKENRLKMDHCATCNYGYYLVEGFCKGKSIFCKLSGFSTW